MINWLDLPSIEQLHNVSCPSPAFNRLLERYLQNQLDMRNDYLVLPSGVPIRDGSGQVVDFDFPVPSWWEGRPTGRLPTGARWICRPVSQVGRTGALSPVGPFGERSFL